MDAHYHFGIHYHIDNGAQVPVRIQNLDEALKFFETKVTEHFGELEASFYEDIHF
jgi:hypothetical protein